MCSNCMQLGVFSYSKISIYHLTVRAFNPVSYIIYLIILKWKLFSHARLFATPRTMESMEFSRPEYWSGYPFPSPGHHPNLDMETRSTHMEGQFFTAEQLAILLEFNSAIEHRAFYCIFNICLASSALLFLIFLPFSKLIIFTFPFWFPVCGWNIHIYFTIFTVVILDMHCPIW